MKASISTYPNNTNDFSQMIQYPSRYQASIIIQLIAAIWWRDKQRQPFCIIYISQYLITVYLQKSPYFRLCMLHCFFKHHRIKAYLRQIKSIAVNFTRRREGIPTKLHFYLIIFLFCINTKHIEHSLFLFFPSSCILFLLTSQFKRLLNWDSLILHVNQCIYLILYK